MPLSAREVLSVQSQQANAAVLFLSRLVGTAGSAAGARTLVTAWQNDFNARREGIVAALQQLADNVRGSNPTQAAGIDALRTALSRVTPLTVDGAWGQNTAFTTALWISTSAPPSRLADLPTWWRANSATLGAARDRIASAYAASTASSPTPPPEASPPPPASSTVAHDTSTPDPASPLAPPTSPASMPTTTRNAGSSASGGGGGTGTIVAGGLALAVLWLVMQGRS